MKLTNYEEVAQIIDQLKCDAMTSKHKQASKSLAVNEQTAIRLVDEEGFSTDAYWDSCQIPKNNSQFKVEKIFRVNLFHDTQKLYAEVKGCAAAVQLSEDCYMIWYKNYKKDTGYFSLLDDLQWSFYRDFLPHNWDKEHKRPNELSVITDKKLASWATYLLERRRAAEENRQFQQKEYNEFMDKIKSISLDDATDYKLEENKGFIIKRGLKLRYTAILGFRHIEIEPVARTSDELIDLFRDLTE